MGKSPNAQPSNDLQTKRPFGIYLAKAMYNTFWLPAIACK